MSNINFEESTIPSYFEKLEAGKGMLTPANTVASLTKTLVKGVTTFLAMKKSKTAPQAVVIKDLKGNFIIAAVVAFNAAEDESEAADGNWNCFWTFNEDDIPEGSETTPITAEPIRIQVNSVGWEICRLQFNSPLYVSELAVDLFSMIKDTLDQNAPSAEGEEWGISLEGYFEAKVVIENNEKAFSFLPIGEMKSLIKSSDKATEV